MTADERFERSLPTILEDLYLGPVPTYRDEVVAAAVRTRQRPSWALPGRWIPMADIASPSAVARRIPWRTVGVALALIALLVATAVVYVGTRPTRTPPPFGVARNGLIAYVLKGDIVVADTLSGRLTQITHTAGSEAEPVFAPNGLSLAYRSSVDGSQPAAENIVVVKPNGSDPIVVNAAPIVGGPKRLEWSPDSMSILATEQNDAAVWLYDVSGKTPVRTILKAGFAFVRPFRPPDGESLLIGRYDGKDTSILSFDLATGRETVLARLADQEPAAARWSPDGSKVVYVAKPTDEPDAQRMFVVNADGTGTRKLVTAPGIGVDIDPAWSPDGTQIAFSRWQQQLDLSWFVKPIGIYSMADGSVRSVGPLPRDVRNRYPGPDDAGASHGEGFYFDWSPDGKSLITYPNEAIGHSIIINASDGTWRALDPVIDTVGFPQSQGWQRLPE